MDELPGRVMRTTSTGVPHDETARLRGSRARGRKQTDREPGERCADTELAVQSAGRNESERPYAPAAAFAYGPASESRYFPKRIETKYYRNVGFFFFFLLFLSFSFRVAIGPFDTRHADREKRYPLRTALGRSTNSIIKTETTAIRGFVGLNVSAAAHSSGRSVLYTALSRRRRKYATCPPFRL